ncbi:hypothetical protein BH11PSE8_BH11PSE8_20260 [soil metagenome]
MKRLLIVLMLVLLGWKGYSEYRAKRAEFVAPDIASEPSDRSRSRSLDDARSRSAPEHVPTTGQYTCDGRTHCSQMTSCAEAKYFLANCPGVQMDGNHDGVPCETQWCK